MISPREILSIGFRILVSRHPAIRTTGLLTVAPAGLPPAEHASLHWTHNRLRLPPHGTLTQAVPAQQSGAAVRRIVACGLSPAQHQFGRAIPEMALFPRSGQWSLTSGNGVTFPVPMALVRRRKMTLNRSEWVEPAHPTVARQEGACPETVLQTSTVRQLRQSMAFASWKDHKAIAPRRPSMTAGQHAGDVTLIPCKNGPLGRSRYQRSADIARNGIMPRITLTRAYIRRAS